MSDFRQCEIAKEDSAVLQKTGPVISRPDYPMRVYLCPRV